MSTTTTDHTSAPPRPAPERGPDPWVIVLAGTTATVAVVDLAFFAVIREVIPPIAAGIVVTVVGLALVRTRPRTAIVLLGLASAVVLAGGLGFAIPHFGHPESGVDWAHAVIGSAGRVLAITAAVAAWRGASERAARRTGVMALGGLGLIGVVALVATAVTSGESAEPGDVAVVVERVQFPDDLTVDAGAVLHIDNRDLVRHTFTVEGTDIDVDLPARQGARVLVDVGPGTYELVCEIPGHDAMTGTVTVR
jgi:plastocyanin